MVTKKRFRVNYGTRIYPSYLNEDGTVRNYFRDRVIGPAPVPGNYYFGYSLGSTASVAALGFGNLRMVPWNVYYTIRIDQFVTEIVTLGDLASVFRFGVYTDNGTCIPAARRADAVSTAMTVVGNVTATTNITLTPGRYWLGGAIQGTGTQPTMRCLSPTRFDVAPLPHGVNPLATGGTIIGAAAAIGNSTLPASWPLGITTAGSVPRVGYRVAEVL